MNTEPHKNVNPEYFTRHAELLPKWLEQNGYGPPPDIETRRHYVTFLPSKFAPSKTSAEITLPELAERIRTKTAKEKFRLPWLKLARFGDKKTDANCVRFDENVLTLSGCETDYDAGLISFDTAVAVMRKAGIRAIVYTSASHTPIEKERWRLVVPFSMEYRKDNTEFQGRWWFGAPEDNTPTKILKRFRAAMVARLNGLLDGVLAIESFRLSLSYLYGAVKGKEDNHRVIVLDGDFLDLRDDLNTQALAEGETREQKKADFSEAPKTDAPKTDTPKTDAPKTDAPNEKADYFENINQGESKWRDINDLAMKHFSLWVPRLFPGANGGDSGYRITSKMLGRDLEEDIAIHSSGIKDFGVHDIGDERKGKRTPLDLVMEWKNDASDLEDAFDWLSEAIGIDAADDTSGASNSAGTSSTKTKTKSPLITTTPFILRAPSAIPVRDWIYGHHLIRKFGSATVALGGVGKSTLITIEALAMATGRALLGIMPTQCCKVWLWNGEDPLEEIERRITAACSHFGITAKELEGNLFVNSGRDSEIIIAKQARDGVKISVPMVEALERTIIDNKIDVLSIDPFISSHRVTENDNNAIDLVAKIWTKLADTTNTAIDLVHHSRKTGGAEVTVEDSRGAGSMINAVRSSRVLNTMSKEEGTKAGVSSPRGYFRTDDGKMNLAPPADKAKWFHLESVELGNGPPHSPFEDGDKVAVVTQWDWPNPLDGVTGKDFEQAAYYIRQKKWRENSQAKDWVGYAIAKALKLNVSEKADKAKIIGLVKYWIGTGALIVVDGEDEKRNSRKFIEVAED